MPWRWGLRMVLPPPAASCRFWAASQGSSSSRSRAWRKCCSRGRCATCRRSYGCATSRMYSARRLAGCCNKVQQGGGASCSGRSARESAGLSSGGNWRWPSALPTPQALLHRVSSPWQCRLGGHACQHAATTRALTIRAAWQASHVVRNLGWGSACQRCACTLRFQLYHAWRLCKPRQALGLQTMSRCLHGGRLFQPSTPHPWSCVTCHTTCSCKHRSRQLQHHRVLHTTSVEMMQLWGCTSRAI